MRTLTLVPRARKAAGGRFRPVVTMMENGRIVGWKQSDHTYFTETAAEIMALSAAFSVQDNPVDDMRVRIHCRASAA